jgi:tetratricopeptide (TPR) repeat protein
MAGAAPVQMRQLVALFNTGRHSELEARTRELTAQHPMAAAAWKILGLCLEIQGKEALPALRKATELLPNDAEAHNNLGNALRRHGHLDEAVASCRKALQLQPNFAEAHSNLGNALRAMGRLDNAMASYRKALQLRPDFAEAHYGLGNVLLDLGRLDAAVANYRRALQLKPRYADAHNNLGNAFLKLGRWQEALASCQQALQLKPDFAEAHNNLGNALQGLHHFEPAVSNYRRALQLRPDFAEARNNLGNALQSLGQLEAAVSSYRCALELKSDYAEAYQNLGNTLQKLRRWDEALASCRRAVQLKPDFPEAHDSLGNALLSVGQLDDALASCRQALELQPDLAEAHGSLGNVWLELGQFDNALACYDRALQLMPDDPASVCQSRSVVLRQLGRAQEAEASCRRAIELKPDAPMPLVVLADLYADRGDFAQAEGLYRRAVALDPDLPEAWSGIARVRKMTDRDTPWLVEAQRVAGQCLASRKEVQLRFAIAKYYDDVCDFEQAFAQYRRANELSRLHAPKYDRERVTAVVDQIILSFDREWLERTRLDVNASERPVLIVGMPRSGTTLAEQILASHPAVYGAGELNFWPRASAGYETACRAESASAALQPLANDYLQVLQDRSGDALRVVDKMPVNFQYLGLIHAAFPKARIIHMRRNPIDTCLSIYFQNFSIVQSYTHDLEDLAHFYAEYRRLMAHWESTLPSDAILHVPYEALVEEQETWSRRMLEFVGVPWDPRCMDFHQTPRTVLTASLWQVRQRINKSSVARWHNYEQFVGPLLHLMASDQR